MNLNLKMTVERSKRRSQFLSLVFITKCFNKNLLLRIKKKNSNNNNGNITWPHTRRARLRFLLTNQDSVGEKNSTEES